MEIVKANERVVLTDCEKCSLNKAYDIIDDIYMNCEDEELEPIVQNILTNLAEFLENYIIE